MSQSTGKYKSTELADAPFKEPGYINAFICLKKDFTTISKPVVSSPAVIGEAFTIATDHAWTTGKEPFKVLVKQDSIEGDGESVGDVGGGRMMWKPKFFMKGDGPIMQEIQNNLLNEEYIVFCQDGLDTGTYIQFGCEDLPSETEKQSFKSGNLSGSGKGMEFSIRSFYRAFYKGTLPVRA